MTNKELARRRSEAARKAWRTRRKNARLRSEAARKAWRTRTKVRRRTVGGK